MLSLLFGSQRAPNKVRFQLVAVLVILCYQINEVHILFCFTNTSVYNVYGIYGMPNPPPVDNRTPKF